MSVREREEQEKVLKLVAPTKSLPCTCVASSLSVSGPFPAIPVPVPVYHLKSCSGDKKLYCRVHNLRDLHANGKEEKNEEGDLSSFFHLYKARESNNF